MVGEVQVSFTFASCSHEAISYEERLLTSTPSYLTEAGFDVGIAISGLIQTLIFAFSNGGDGISWSWWGNSIATQGLDYQSYIQNSTLLPLPEKGYFGPDPGSFPATWGGYGSPQ